MPATSAPTEPAPPDAAEAARRALAEGHVALLGRLAEFGMEVAAAIAGQASAARERPERGVVVRDMGLAYSRVARAVRMTVALRSRLLEDLHAPKPSEPAETGLVAGAPASWTRPAVMPPTSARVARIEQVCDVVDQVINERYDEDDLITVDLGVDAYERLDDPDVYGEMLDRPISELVALVCRDLGLSPDWASLAQERWAQAEIASGAVGEPLRAWLRSGDAPSDAAETATPRLPEPQSASP